MYTEKDFIKDYKMERIKFYEKNFLGRNIYTAFCDVFESSLIRLASVYMQFLLLRDCMNIIINDDLAIKMNKDQKKVWLESLSGLDVICGDLENIIKPINDGMISVGTRSLND